MLGAPVMSKSTFIRTERDIGDWWTDKVMESLLEAGVGKRTGWLSRLVLHEGVPAVTVIVDGGGGRGGGGGEKKPQAFLRCKFSC